MLENNKDKDKKKEKNRKIFLWILLVFLLIWLILQKWSCHRSLSLPTFQSLEYDRILLEKKEYFTLVDSIKMNQIVLWEQPVADTILFADTLRKQRMRVSFDYLPVVKSQVIKVVKPKVPQVVLPVEPLPVFIPENAADAIVSLNVAYGQGQGKKISALVDQSQKIVFVPTSSILNSPFTVTDLVLFPHWERKKDQEVNPFELVLFDTQKNQITKYHILPLIERIEIENNQIAWEIHAGDMLKPLQMKLVFHPQAMHYLVDLDLRFYFKSVLFNNNKKQDVGLVYLSHKDRTYYYTFEQAQLDWLHWKDQDNILLQLDFTNFKQPWVLDYVAQVKKLQYEITSDLDFQAMRLDLNGEYRIKNDLVFHNTFIPVGDLEQPFKGKLQGNKKKILIKNFNPQARDYFGLFGVIRKAQISDFTIQVQKIEALDFGQQDVSFGFLVGQMQNSKIENIKLQIENHLQIYSASLFLGALVGQVFDPSQNRQEKLESILKNITIQAKKIEVNTADNSSVGLLIGHSNQSLRLENIQLNALGIQVNTDLYQALVGGIVGAIIDNNQKELDLVFEKKIHLSVKNSLSSTLYTESSQELDFAMVGGLVGYAYYTHISLDPQLDFYLNIGKLFVNGEKTYAGGLVGKSTHPMSLGIQKEMRKINLTTQIEVGGDKSLVKESYAGGLGGQIGSFGYRYDSQSNAYPVFLGNTIQLLDFSLEGGIVVIHNDDSDGLAFTGGLVGACALSKISQAKVYLKNGIQQTRSAQPIGTAAGFVGKLINLKEKNFIIEKNTLNKPFFDIIAYQPSFYIGGYDGKEQF